MNTISISESGMDFGLHPAGNLFYIEKSRSYQNIQSRVRIAEFLLLHPSHNTKFYIIEAKSSSPKPQTQPSFDEFIKEICEKFANSLALFMAVYLKRHSSTCCELPQSFQNLAIDKADFRLTLIIKGHKEDWLQPLQDALRKALYPMVRTWDMSPNSVLVLNDTIARRYKLIS
ncbi:hypothetical protein [Synechococcus sp. PCC 7336]|uniref:hypothetical protein n=1 Tax=Synechococcus sp. PCC 7336 TaxID=195250 RepID=UPI00036F7ADF|nr:hypothetical protein [Synechococcus sp. PCC 7336]